MSIRGHQKQRAHLRDLSQSGKLPHALLFTGPEGIGKKKVAIQLVQNLFCSSIGTDGEACGTCSQCHRIQQNTHPDFLSISPESNLIKTEVIRQLKQKLSFQPLEAPYKIALIAEAHFLHTSAANVLLKTLEEPPEKTLLILISSSPYKILRTILSRCQKLTFSPLEMKEMQQVMEELGYSVASHPDRLTLAQGSPGLFLKFSEEAFEWVQNQILPSLEAQPKDLMKLLEAAEKISKEDALTESVLSILLMKWNQAIQRSLDHAKKTEAIYQTLRKLKETHVNPQLTFENLFLKLCL